MNTSIHTIQAKDYTYHLPDERIAKFPLEKRDESKLLVYQQGEIRHSQFKYIDQELDNTYTLFFNNTKVIPARLLFRKDTGGVIELFLLNPTSPTHFVNQVMLQTQPCVWACIIGGLKKWKDGQLLTREVVIDNHTVSLQAELLDRQEQLVRFSWNNNQVNFATLIAAIGSIPLPPYLKREVVEKDKDQYQTVYSKHEGAVAAPTAGLHFTEEVLAKLKAKGITEDFLTLHVAGGTFQPLRTDQVTAHQMHAEQVIISKENIKTLLNANKIACVGTTSVRSLESLFWFGVKVWELQQKNDFSLQTFWVEKLQPYQYSPENTPTRATVFRALWDYMERHQLDNLVGETEIMIVPSYPYQCCDALITNFHQPDTTLILLVAAFVGEDWRKIYQAALDNDYRFLSYGDSSLLFGQKQ